MRRGYNDSVKIDGTKEKCSLPGAPSSGGKKGKSGGKAGPGVSSGGATSMASGSLDDVEGGCFDMPNYRVSVVSRDVVEMTHETLVEACAAEPASAKLLFQTSRDLLFLFRAVVPTLYADDIANDARACMLFHNDCLYIAHHMLTIGYLYKQRYVRIPLSVELLMSVFMHLPRTPCYRLTWLDDRQTAITVKPDSNDDRHGPGAPKRWGEGARVVRDVPNGRACQWRRCPPGTFHACRVVYTIPLCMRSKHATRTDPVTRCTPALARRRFGSHCRPH